MDDLKDSLRPDRPIRVLRDVKIPLRDGIRLSATVYLPPDNAIPVPCILTITPYISDIAHERGVQYAREGFVLVAVDARGRGDSEGEFRPFIQEAPDGHDAVEWLARQPYCNGKVAMLGGSYSGYNQWATAKERPPHLFTIVPTAAPCIGVDFPMRNNIFYPYLVQWLTFTRGRASQAQAFYDVHFWSALFKQWHVSGRPFRHVDEMCGNPSGVFQEWLSHPEQGAFWDAFNPSVEEYASLEIPILTITGHYDDDQPGALAHYRNHMRHGSPDARLRHYLVIGPWDHRGTSVASRRFGGLEFGEASCIDLPMLRLEWYRWTLLQGTRPEFLKRRVCYYVTGAERWRYTDTLEEATSGCLRLYLDSQGGAGDVFRSGALGSEPGHGTPDSYTYDPRVTSGADVDAEARGLGGSLVDQQLTLSLAGRQLVYHSAPLDRDREITGFFHLDAWISLDCPDTDLYVSAHEVCSDGSCIRLSTDVIRARYREDLRVQSLVQTSEPLLYQFCRFTFVSRQMRKGHRLRLVIAPVGRLVETTFAEKNYNGGGVVAEESAQVARAVTVKLFHDVRYPSVLLVPLGREAADADAHGRGLES